MRKYMIIKKKYIGSYGVIIEKNKIVLIRKSGGGYQGKLDLPGGGIEYQEDPVATLKREIDEEVGVIVKDYQLLDVLSNNIMWQMNTEKYEDLHHIGIIYKVKIEGNIKKEADGRDSLGSNWYSINELKRHELTPFASKTLEKLGYKLK